MRIVALSDQHGHLPRIPQCDLLIVAGDVCPDRFGPFLAMHAPEEQRAWFDRHVRPWLAEAPATHTILTWGNHDWCGQSRHLRGDSQTRASTDLQILVDEQTTVVIGDEPVSVWATPWSNQFMKWAFMKAPKALEAVYAGKGRAPREPGIAGCDRQGQAATGDLRAHPRRPRADRLRRDPDL